MQAFSEMLQPRCSHIAAVLTHMCISTEEPIEGISVWDPCTELLQNVPEGDQQGENSEMEILHKRTLYDLCGFDDNDEDNIEKVVPL
jgi:hypothetical protein